MTKTTADLFWSKVETGWTHDCWEWTASTFSNGYGQFGAGRSRGLSTLAHRVSYLLIKGDPEDLVIDHLCRNRKCVNPQHLEAVTHKENVIRERAANGENRNHFSMNRGKTHCVNGHSNWDDRWGRRSCIDCRRESWARQNAKRKERNAR